MNAKKCSLMYLLVRLSASELERLYGPTFPSLYAFHIVRYDVVPPLVLGATYRVPISHARITFAVYPHPQAWQARMFDGHLLSDHGLAFYPSAADAGAAIYRQWLTQQG
jgi:hypothetical protein